MTQDPVGTPALEALVTRAVEGDREAQDELLVKFWPVIRGAVRARLCEAVRALGEDDLKQEIALRMLQRLPTFRGEGVTSLAAWVRAIADNVIVDALRYQSALKRGRRDTDPLEDEPAARESSSPESKIHRRRRADALVAELLLMTEAERAPLELHEQGYSYPEIADIVGITPEAARKRVDRARERLRERLG